jgi:hypothetical protein
VLLAACSDGAKGRSAEAVERDTRVALPVGSTRSRVQEYLTERGIESSFDPQSKTISAIVRKLKGSNLIVREDLLFKFHFDDSLKLTRIDAKVVHTGP